MKSVEEVQEMMIQSSSLGTAISIAFNAHGATRIKRCTLFMGEIWQVWI